MFINYVWTGPPPTDLSIVLTNPVKLAKILDTRGRTQPQWLHHQINFWCFHEFTHDFTALFHRAVNFDSAGRYVESLVNINVKSINNLLNETEDAFGLGIDNTLLNQIKYCLEVSEMIRAFNLMKEIVTPLILACYPGYYADTTLEFNENFNFPLDGLPKLPRVGEFCTPSLADISIYTVNSGFQFYEKFKKSFRILKGDSFSTGSLIHVPLIDVWFLFCPPSEQYRKIFVHLVRAICVYIMDSFPPSAILTTQMYLECNLRPGHLEALWRSEGLPLFTSLIDVADPTTESVNKLRLLKRFNSSVHMASLPIFRPSLLSHLIMDPYIEIFCFLYPESDLGAFHSPIFINTDPGGTPFIQTILKYGIVKRFGASGWRKMLPTFVDLSETYDLSEKASEKLSTLETFPYEKARVLQEFENFLRS